MGFNLGKALGIGKAERWVKRQTRGGVGAALDYYSGKPLDFLADYGLPLMGASALGLGGSLGEAGKWGLGRLGLSSGAASSPTVRMAGAGTTGTSIAGGAGAATPAALASSGGGGTLGAIGSWLEKNASTDKAMKFINTPTGKMLLSNLVLPQLFPNPDNGNIQNLINQAGTARASALKQLTGGQPYSSGGPESRWNAEMAGRGTGTGTMGQVGGALAENARARATQDYNLKNAGMTADVEGGYLRELYRIYGAADNSNSQYYQRLGTLAEGLGEMFG